MSKEKVYVTNIISDEVQVLCGYEFHKVVCDCINTTFSEKQVCRIFSPHEYLSVMEKGYYLIPDIVEE